jgi:ferredoxin-NADP reductase
MPNPIANRILSSRLVDMLVGPHGVDRYLELVDPLLTVSEARAVLVGARRQTARSITLQLRPNAAFAGFTAGQYLTVAVEIDGVRRTRTYSPASSQRARDGRFELTVTRHPGGLVSRHLCERLHAGAVLHLGPAQGDFVLPEPRPPRLVLISGGSGITPVLSMLRTLCDEGHEGEVAFLHYARTAADWLYRSEVEALARAHPNVKVAYTATREGGAHLSERAIAELLGGRRLDGTLAAVCGPRALIEAVEQIYGPDVLQESFEPPSLALAAAASPDGASLRFERSGRCVPAAEGTLLEQAEAAGLTPPFGCRMGICHTCTTRKLAGAVRNLRSGEISTEEHEDIQLCISAPAGDVMLEL